MTESGARREAETFLAAAVQMDVRFGDRPGNLERVLERARTAALQGARLIVFPECALTGYAVRSRDEAASLAEPVPGPATERLVSACAQLDTTVICGLVESDGDQLYNTAVVVDGAGIVARYRKVHLPGVGVDRFLDAGENPFEVIDLGFCRIGLNICYDGSFPEPSRSLTLDGADILVLPTNWPRGAEPFGRYVSNARAFENVVYYIASNRIGEERGTRFVGLSRICDPLGWSLAEADESSEAILVAEIDPLRARQKRIERVPGEHIIDRIADRRPEFYRRLQS